MAFGFGRRCAVLAMTLALGAMATSASAQGSKAQQIAEAMRRGQQIELTIRTIESVLDTESTFLLVDTGGVDPMRLGARGVEYVPINRDYMQQMLVLAVFEGKIQAEELPAYIESLRRRSAQNRGNLNARLERMRQEKQRNDALIAALSATARPPAQPLPPSAYGRPPAPAAVARRTSRNGCEGFAGTWDTNYGPMWLTGSGAAVSGSYEWSGAGGHRDGDTLTGSMNGNVLEGTYSQPGYPEARWRSGKLRFVLSADGNSFAGEAWDSNGASGGAWNGTCNQGPNGPAAKN